MFPTFMSTFAQHNMRIMKKNKDNNFRILNLSASPGEQNKRKKIRYKLQTILCVENVFSRFFFARIRSTNNYIPLCFFARIKNCVKVFFGKYDVGRNFLQFLFSNLELKLWGMRSRRQLAKGKKKNEKTHSHSPEKRRGGCEIKGRHRQFGGKKMVHDLANIFFSEK